MPLPDDPRYNIAIPTDWTSWSGASLPFTSFAKEVVVPGIASLWAWAKLFNTRTNDLDKRVNDLERQIAGLENVVAILQAVDAERLPPYEA